MVLCVGVEEADGVVEPVEPSPQEVKSKARSPQSVKRNNNFFMVDDDLSFFEVILRPDAECFFAKQTDIQIRKRSRR